jgi:hypothetical protein
MLVSLGGRFLTRKTSYNTFKSLIRSCTIAALLSTSSGEYPGGVLTRGRHVHNRSENTPDVRVQRLLAGEGIWRDRIRSCDRRWSTIFSGKFYYGELKATVKHAVKIAVKEAIKEMVQETR